MEFEPEFEWDENKNKANIIKHGIDFNTAALVFNDDFRYEELDVFNSVGEIRYVTVGQVKGRLMLVFVSYTERNNRIRIISARKANQTERRRYYDREKGDRF